MTKKRKKPEFTPAQLEFIVEQFNKDFNTQFGEHFINFVIKQEKFDFNEFGSQEEFDRYLKDMEIFGAGEVKSVARKNKK